MKNVLLVGGGYVAAALAAKLQAAGSAVSVLKRRKANVGPGINFIQADVTQADSIELSGEFDALVYSISAAEHSETAYRSAYVDGLRNVLQAVREAKCLHGPFVFISSTGVYAQSGGEWVDEESEVNPAHFSGSVIRDAEEVLLRSKFEKTILRLGGIYGPTRTRMIDEVKNGIATRSPGPPVYTNRIHRDDAAGILFHILKNRLVEEIFIGVDSLPAPKNEVLEWLSATLGLPEPPFGDYSPGRNSVGSKRCSNKKILSAGYEFQYPSYKEGYLPLLG